MRLNNPVTALLALALPAFSSGYDDQSIGISADLSVFAAGVDQVFDDGSEAVGGGEVEGGVGLVVEVELADDALDEQGVAIVNSSQPCDSDCVHRILYRTAYSSAASGVTEVLTACEAIDWCANDNKDWCPDAVNSTVSATAGHAIGAVSVDFHSCGDACLLSLLATIGQTSAVSAMRWAESLMNGDMGQCVNQTQIQKLRQTIWYLGQQRPAVVDQEVLANAMAASPSNVSIHHEQHSSRDKGLMIGLPFLPSTVLAPFAANAVCATDAVLCESKTVEYLRRIFSAAKEVLPKASWLRYLIGSAAAEAATQALAGDVSITESVMPDALRNTFED